MTIQEKKQDRSQASPIFIEEVNLYLKDRFKDLIIENKNENHKTPTKKILDYCHKFCFLRKEKIKEIRNYINESTENFFSVEEERIQAEIILCKIVDLNPDTYGNLISLIPGYKKYFTSNQFRKHYKKIHSLVNE